MRGAISPIHTGSHTVVVWNVSDDPATPSAQRKGPCSQQEGLITSDCVPLAEIMVGQFPDWFPDPTNLTTERFWDGSRWTDRTRIAIPTLESDGSRNDTQPLRLDDLLQPIEPLLLAILDEELDASGQDIVGVTTPHG